MEKYEIDKMIMIIDIMKLKPVNESSIIIIKSNNNKL